jgi:hypothetical protein
MAQTASKAVEQLSLDQAERGLAQPIALLRLEPAEIAQKLGIRFESAEDDLDKFQTALLCTVSGKQFALVRYDNSPGTGTEIWVNEKSANISRDLKEALEVLRMELSDVEWMHPDIH